MKPISDNPRYAAARLEYEQMGSALGKVQSRIVELESLMRSHTGDQESNHVAAAMEFAQTGKVKAPDNTPTALSEEHVVLRQQRDALQSALRARADALISITGEISGEVCASLEAKHKALAGRYLAKLLELDAMYAEETEMVSAIERAGYNARFREYIQWPFIGTQRIPEAAINSHIREISRYAK